MQYEDRLTIATPEGVEVELPLAGLGSRCAAAALDGLIKLAVGVALGVIVVALGGGAIVITVALIATFLVFFAYDVLFETLGGGRTLGKQAVGLRVVLSGGHPIGFRQSAVRNLLRLIEYPLGYLPAIVSVLVTTRNQRLGDIAADALVVRDHVGPTHAAAPWPRGPVPGREPVTWDLSAVTVEDLFTVREFLERREGLTPDARARLAEGLAARLRGKVAGAPDELAPEAFLERVALEKAARA